MSQSTVTVTVAPLEAVRLTAPVDGAQYAPGTVIPLQAVAPPGSTVEFLCNGTVVGTRTSPYTMLVTLSAGVKVFAVRLKAVTPPQPPPPPPAPILASPNDTYGPTVTDASGGVWTLGASDGAGHRQTLRNGVQQAGGLAVAYLWLGGVVYVDAETYGWYRWAGSWIAFNPETEAADVRPFRGRRGGGGTYVPPAVGVENAWTVGTTGILSGGEIFVQGAVPAGSAVQVGSFTTQTDWKATHPDGSLKHGLVSCNATSTGVKALTVIAAPGGSFTPTWPTCVVTIDDGTDVWTATLPVFASMVTHGDGAVLRDTRSAAIAFMDGATPHPLLQMIFDVRSFVNGDHQISCVFQNHKDPNTLEGLPNDWVPIDELDITINGSSVYNRTTHTPFRYTTRGVRRFWTSGASVGAWTYNFEPWYDAKAIPRLRSSVTNTTPTVNENAHGEAANWSGPYGAGAANFTRFGLFGFGDSVIAMSSVGNHAELGPMPDYHAPYFVHQTAAQKAYMLAAGDTAGSWPGHLTLEDGVTLISLDTYPQWAFQNQVGRPTGPNGEYYSNGIDGNTILRGQVTGYLIIESAHQYSLAFQPYLVTCDRYYLDELKQNAQIAIAFWADGYPGYADRNGADGLVMVNPQIRGIGWAFHALLVCAGFIPDADPYYEYFRSRVELNLAAFDARAASEDGGPLDASFPLLGYAGGPYPSIAGWQNQLIMRTIDRAIQWGFTGGEDMRARLIDFQMKLFIGNGESPWQTAWGQGNMIGWPILSPDTGVIDTATFYDTFTEIHDRSMAIDPRDVYYVGNYGVDYWVFALIAHRLGIAGATTVLDFLETTESGGVLTDMDGTRRGWALERTGFLVS